MRNKKSTAQKMKFSIMDFFGKRDQIRNFLRIWSYLLRKFLMENFTFCAVKFGKNKIMTTKKPSYLLMNNVDEIQFCINHAHHFNRIDSFHSILFFLLY